MIIYIFLFILTLALAFLFDISKEKVSSVIFVSFCLLIGAFVGLGDMLGGYDRYIYCEVFDSYSDQVQSGNGMFNNNWYDFFTLEPGYGLINFFIAKLTLNRYVFILIFTICVYLLFGISIYRFSDKPFFALVIFLGMCFFFSFTYIRQIMAMAILWNSIQFIEKRQALPFFVLVLFAASIHNAAIYFALIYFIPIRNYSKTFIVISMFILLIIGIISPFNMLFEAYGDLTSASRKAEMYKQTSEYGFRIEYLFESLLFIIILLINYDKIKFTRRNAIQVNMYLMFCGTLLLFIKSSDGGRMSWLFAVGIILVLTELAKNDNGVGVKLTSLGISFALYLRVLILWGILIYPYKSFLTDGYREGDYIHTIYEYDSNYDIDKFYR